MSNINFSHFKKVNEDKATATLIHPKGHEIKISKGHLSPSLRTQLEKLPIHKAEGGDTYPAHEEDANPEDAKQPEPAPDAKPQGVNININAQPNQAQGQPQVQAAPAPQNQPPAQGLAPQPAPADQGAPQAMDPNSPETQAANAALPAQQSPKEQQDEFHKLSEPAQPVDKQKQISDELNAENAAWQQDLHNGDVKPMTYRQLFAKQDTLGKIGTVFGLIVGGAGMDNGGNAMLNLMQKQIDNDLEAQKQSKINAQNYLRLSQANEANQAGVGATKQETETKAYALAQTRMLQSSYHDLAQQTMKMPEGPQKESAKQILGLIYNKVGEKIADINDQAAGAAAFGQIMFGNQDNGGGGSGEQGFQKKTSNIRMMGPEGETRAKDLEAKHFPGLRGQASIPLEAGDREQLNSGIAFDQKLHRFMDWTKKHSGDVNPKDRHEGEAMAAELQGAYRQATHGGVYKEGEQNFISKLIDSTPTKFFNSIRVLPQLQALSDENKSRVDQFARSKGFQGYGSSGGGKTSAGSKSEGTQEGATGKSNGRPVIFKGGKWVLQ